MGKHTPGPLFANVHHGEGVVIIGPGRGQHVGVVQLGPDRIHAEADADRLVACWNACEGINPEAVSDMLAALETAESYLSRLPQCADRGHDIPADLAAARAAIAKATNGEG